MLIRILQKIHTNFTQIFFAIWNNHLLNLYYSAVITKLQYNNKKYSFNQLLVVYNILHYFVKQ
ncbi:hypothetical protein QU38_13425 [Staphylococcus aureus]|uniref:Uncharacterized protein n=1 Tax=Staphylococcus aureus TaxID=1280 RepID=A0AA40JL56_STAAU|nr:hypothetical protein QU38_13425 [Staphylococcus aureus]